MKQSRFIIEKNIPLADRVYKMILSGDTSAITKSGQFVNIKIDGLFLRRPISVCDRDEKTFTIIYKVVGEGTKRMSEYKTGDFLDILCGLGNGYDTSPCKKSALLLGGGVGVPPLYLLAKELTAEGKKVSVVLGFNGKSEVFLEDEFKKAGASVIVATADGSYGKKGFVTDVLCGIEYDYFFCCGPEAMLRAVYKCTKTDGQFSFEERMGCGYGACMGCSCKTITGNKRICKEGPVLKKEEILWEG